MNTFKSAIIEFCYCVLLVSIPFVFEIVLFVIPSIEILSIVAMTCFLSGIFVIFGDILGKILSSLFSLMLACYLLAQKYFFSVHGTYYDFSVRCTLAYTNKPLIFVLAAFLICLFLIYIRYFRVKWTGKWRIVAITLFIISNFVFSIQDKEIYHRYIERNYLANTTEYYYLSKTELSSESINSCGIITFAKNDLSLKINDYLYGQETKNKIDEYINNKQKPVSNEFTGIFEEKNLIIIQGNRLSRIKTNDSDLSTLHNIYENSIRIEGFNNSGTIGRTSDCEFMANTSMVPNGMKTYAVYDGDSNYYPVTLASIFNDSGYRTTYCYKDHEYWFNREKMVGVYGYNEFVFGDIINQNGTVDNSQVGLFIANSIVPNEKRMIYWVADEGSADADLNDGIQCVIEKLISLGVENDYVIVIFDDEPVYSLGSLLIYSPATPNMTIEKSSTTIDILPTIANIFELNYDYPSVIGMDIFSNQYAGLTFWLYDYQETEYDKDLSFWTLGKTKYKFLNHYGFDDNNKFSLDVVNQGELLSKTIDISQKMLFLDYFRVTSFDQINSTKNK